MALPDKGKADSVTSPVVALVGTAIDLRGRGQEMIVFIPAGPSGAALQSDGQARHKVANPSGPGRAGVQLGGLA